jgi:hypothetical protein
MHYGLLLMLFRQIMTSGGLPLSADGIKVWGAKSTSPPQRVRIAVAV